MVEVGVVRSGRAGGPVVVVMGEFGADEDAGGVVLKALGGVAAVPHL